jgi:uncharacterized protein (TIGR02284 family)
MAMAIESLKKLHARLIDTQESYEDALQEVRESALAPLFVEMIDLRERDLMELEQLLTEKDADGDDDGSLMSVVQKAAIDVRSSLTGLDKNALPSFIRGEERIVSAYDDALQACDDDPKTCEILGRQKQELQDRISHMQLLSAA